MALIEGIGDDVMTLLFVIFIVLIVIMSWLSTSVREIMVPANLLVIERRSRRLYTANFNNANNPSRLAPSLTTTTTTNEPDAPAAGDTQVTGPSAPSSSSTVVSSSATFEPATRRRSNELELVNEIVEQALVDNLLDGGFYSTEEIDLNGDQTSSTAAADSPIASGSGEVVSSVRNSALFNSARSSSLMEEEPSSEDSGAPAQLAPTDSTESVPLAAEPINILIKFVNEKEMRIQARPSDTILVIKKTHFSQEISSNKIVRFIYQGQFLNDTMTIKSYNIRDQTTIHCHIVPKPSAPSGSGAQHSDAAATTLTTSSSSSSSSSSSLLRQRLTTTAARLQASPVETSMTTTTLTTETSVTTTTTTSVTSGQPPAPPQPQSRGGRVLASIDVNSLLLPLLALVLAASWYFRINFKHFFSPLSTLVLIVLTFVYALFLFNNIHATSTLVANNFVISSRILQSRRRRGAGATTEASPPPPAAPVAPVATHVQ